MTTKTLATQIPCPTRRMRGSAFIEFVVVAPLILFIAGYTVRFAQQLQAQQIGLVVAREIATAAFLQCADYTIQQVPQPNTCGTGSDLCIDQTATETAIRNCLTNARNSFTGNWNSVRPPTASGALTINLAVYRYNIASFTVIPPAQCGAAAASSVTTIQPTGATAGFVQIGQRINNADSPSLQSICSQNRMAKAAISFDIQPSGNFLPGISNTPITITHEITL